MSCAEFGVSVDRTVSFAGIIRIRFKGFSQAASGLLRATTPTATYPYNEKLANLSRGILASKCKLSQYKSQSIVTYST